MYNVAIVEDERSATELLESYLARYSEENGVEFRSASFENPIVFLESYKQGYDLVLLDIELPDMMGMDVARKFREIDDAAALVFVTNMAQYAIDGYSVNADDFIVKPVSYFDFAMKLKRILKKIDRNDGAKVTLYDDGLARLVSLTDVRYVEVRNHTLIYHTVDGEYEARGVLKRVESLLSANNFVRCNNYCMVNLRYVAGLKDYTLYVTFGRGRNEREGIGISHPRKKDFVKALNDYLGEII